MEKAIEYFYNQMEIGKIESDCQQAIFEIAISALEKQIAKKPRAKHYEDEREPAYIKYKCPNGCGSRYRLLGNVEKYCMNCGQAIDWEG